MAEKKPPTFGKGFQQLFSGCVIIVFIPLLAFAVLIVIGLIGSVFH